MTESTAQIIPISSDQTHIGFTPTRANPDVECSTAAPIPINQRTTFIDRVGNSRQGVTEAQPAAKRMRFLLAAHGATVNLSYCVVLSSHLHPGLTPGFSDEKTAHTLSGFAESLLPYRWLPNQRSSKSISHQLDDFLRSCRPLPTHFMHSRPGWLALG